MSSGERYEPQRNQWEMIPSMHRQRSDASAAALQDKIYIVGGFNGREVLNSAEVFDVETNQWSYIHPMLNPRSGVSLVAFRDSLYALGGFDGFTRLSSGQASSENQEKANQGGEWAVETNSAISIEEEESVNFEEHVQGEVGPMNEMADSVGNFLG